MYQRLVEILRLLTSSGLIMIPTEADFGGPMGPSIEKYLGSAGGNAEDRVRLMRLAWDMTISGFGGRQAHYENFFFGDPVRMRQALYNVYDRSAQVDRVKSFVADPTWPD
jgi:4-hydroxyphenylacetate 3-monooxygenase